ncbi:hypothetical protein LCGC14_2932380 [marine sediment metagenome]|uniref:AP2/ERF domain-containing protein n=1 Tax=marine sediment metagenome TaxID=412755 RepID=A0A0F8Y7J1_9ZZZZ
MQNKPNLRNAEMNVNTVITKDYENKPNWTLGENKPNFKGKKMLLRLTINGRRESVGYYADEIEAAKAYGRAAKAVSKKLVSLFVIPV